MPRTFGEYELIEEIARGGMGVVYKARQRSLNRIVAVKMVLTGPLAKRSELDRFRAEAETAARLQHPNIVAIHEVGDFEGQPFFSMDYVESKNLAELAHNVPLPTKRAAGYLRTIAKAVHYAHSKGVLHRDLKPSNILIDQNDQPRITDFGLAKRLDDYEHSTPGNQLTVSGQVLGSPNFMPPEQAIGDKKGIGPASDVYSLGAVLYQLLTGRPPFLAETLTQTLRLVAETEPVPPRLLNPMVPRDLETICLKCLDKTAYHRYASSQDLADELNRFLREEPILARPASRSEKMWRWCRRHAAVAILGAAVLTLLVIVATVSLVSATRLKAANQRAIDKLWEAYVGQARAERWSGRAGRRLRGLELIKAAAEIRTPIELRNEAIACLALEDLHPIKQLKFAVDHEPYFDRDFDRYAANDGEGNWIIRSVVHDKELVRLSGWQPGGWCRFSPDGRFLFVYRGDESSQLFRVYDLRSQQAILSRTNSFVRNIHFDADGCQLIAAVGGPSTILCYSLPSGEERELCKLPFLAGAISSTAAGDKLAIACEQTKAVEVWATDSGQKLLTLTLSSNGRALDWHPDGSLLATGCEGGEIELWDATAGKRLAVLQGHKAPANRVFFSHDGDRLASSSWDNSFRLWNVWTARQLLIRPFGNAAQFSLDDRRTAMGHMELSEICQLTGRREFREFCPHTDPSSAWQCSWSPDGRLLASGDLGGLRLWNVASGKQLRLPFNELVEGWGVAFDPRGRFLTAGTATGLRCWSLSWERGAERDQLVVGSEERFGPACSTGLVFVNETGNILVTSCGDAMQVYEWPNRRLLRSLTLGPGGWGVWGGLMSPSGRLSLGWPYSSSQPRCVWDVTTGAPLKELAAASICGGVFTHDDRLLITASLDEYVAWDTRYWTNLWKLRRDNPGDAGAIVAVTHNGALGALGLSARTVGLFNPRTGKKLAVLEAPEPENIGYLAFSPDDGLLAATTRSGAIQLWDLRLIRQELATMKLDWDAPPFSASDPRPATPVTIVSRPTGTKDP